MLIVLVGTNPLPCLVLTKYLHSYQNLSDYVLLIASNEVANVADKLKVEIEKLNVPCEDICLENSANGSFVYREVKKVVEDKLTKYPGHIHLNYTGGRKSMSVHTYRAIKDIQFSATFSYLDAFNHQIVYDNESYDPKPSEHDGVSDLRQLVTVDLETLLDLHDIKCEKWEQEPKHLNVARWLFELVKKSPNSPEPNFEIFQKWIEQLAPEKSENGDKNLLAQKLYPSATGFEALEKQISQDFEIAVDAQWINLSNKKYKSLRKTLHGTWLENIVLQVVISLKEIVTPPITACYINVEAKAKRKNPTNNDSPIEIDVVVIQGYALTLISCTTAGYGDTKGSRGTLKGKAFEVLRRAEQLGGEEARAVLIGLEKSGVATDLEEDLSSYYGGKTAPLRILGREDLADLTIKLKDVLNQ
jgi:Domain of unknown function (DUF1887)